MATLREQITAIAEAWERDNPLPPPPPPIPTTPPPKGWTPPILEDTPNPRLDEYMRWADYDPRG